MTDSITKRDLFAAVSLLALLPEFMSSNEQMTPESFAQFLVTAWRTSDAMLAAHDLASNSSDA